MFHDEFIDKKLFLYIETIITFFNFGLDSFQFGFNSFQFQVNEPNTLVISYSLYVLLFSNIVITFLWPICRSPTYFRVQKYVWKYRFTLSFRRKRLWKTNSIVYVIEWCWWSDVSSCVRRVEKQILFDLQPTTPYKVRQCYFCSSFSCAKVLVYQCY